MTLLKMKQQPLMTDGFNNLLQNFFSPLSSFNRNDFETGNKFFVPVNISENENGYRMEIVAPGFSKEQFQVNLDKNMLTISAEKNNETESNDKEIRTEYSYASFRRSFTLDKDIDGESISAEYINGVLVLNLPKKAEVKAPAKQITIN